METELEISILVADTNADLRPRPKLKCSSWTHRTQVKAPVEVYCKGLLQCTAIVMALKR